MVAEAIKTITKKKEGSRRVRRNRVGLPVHLMEELGWQVDLKKDSLIATRKEQLRTEVVSPQVLDTH